MPASRKTYLDDLARLRDRVHSAVEAALLGTAYSEEAGLAPGSWAPAVDVVETEGAYVLSAEIPGVAREDVDLSAEGRRLEISGRRPLPGDRTFAQMERSYGPFRRVFELPAPIDADAVSAELSRGVLTVTVPKRSAGRKVEVEEAEGG